MGKYLKLFKTDADYQSFVNGDTFITPNVSAVGDEAVFFHPYEKEVISPNRIITYTASEKLSEAEPSEGGYSSGIQLNGFNTTIVSHEFVDGVGTIIFEEDVTEIGEYAFFYCDGLTSIEIPDSVTSIGSHAFDYCKGLTSINIPDSVTEIGEKAFDYCKGLTSIEIPDSVTFIQYATFRDCSSLTEVIIGSGVTTIGNYVFENCSGLTSIYYNSTKSDWNAIYKEPWWNNNSNIERIICTDGVIEIQNTIQVGMISVHDSDIRLAVNESRFIGFNIMDTTWKGNITNAVENAKDGNYYYYEYDTNSLSVRTAHENMKGDGYYVVEVTGLQPGVYTLTINAGPDMKGGAVTQDITVTVTE
jgi:hypothetical protein